MNTLETVYNKMVKADIRQRQYEETLSILKEELEIFSKNLLNYIEILVLNLEMNHLIFFTETKRLIFYLKVMNLFLIQIIFINH